MKDGTWSPRWSLLWWFVTLLIDFTSCKSKVNLVL